MGTNYYLTHVPCSQCAHRAERVHIGKDSHGWSFSFHSTFDVRSYEDWKKEFQDPRKEIVDEYGNIISAKDFDVMVQSKKDGLNHARIVCGEGLTDKEKEYLERRRRIPGIYDNHAKYCWLDSEGHSFCSLDFS